LHDMKEFYESYWRYRRRIGHISQKRMPIRLKIIASMINKTPSDVLDVGCGEGGVGILLRKKYGHNVNLFGIDISEIALEMAKPYYNRVKQVDVEKEDLIEIYGNRKFDYIIASEVLEHLIKPEEVLEKLKLLLKPRGYIIVSFPNFAFWRNRIDVLFRKFPRQYLYQPIEHIHYWTFFSFVEFLEKHGLRIEQVNGVFEIPFSRFLPKSVVTILGKKFPNFLGSQLIFKTKKRM